jgi:hypothetical protein
MWFRPFSRDENRLLSSNVEGILPGSRWVPLLQLFGNFAKTEDSRPAQSNFVRFLERPVQSGRGSLRQKNPEKSIYTMRV